MKSEARCPAAATRALPAARRRSIAGAADGECASAAGVMLTDLPPAARCELRVDLLVDVLEPGRQVADLAGLVLVDERLEQLLVGRCPTA